MQEEKKTPLLRGLQVAAVCGAVLAANPSDAAIIGSRIQGGFVNQPQDNLGLKIIEPPPEGIITRSFEGWDENGNYFQDPNPDPTRDLIGIIEKQSVVLPRNVSVLDEFGTQTFRPNDTIAKDTLVSSYLFYVNPPAGGQPYFEWSGEITFDAPILGIVGGFFVHWPQTTNVVGLDNTTYQLRTALDAQQDRVSWENNVLTFNISAVVGMEPFRVITSGNPVVASVPEPLTILGSGAALGFGILFRKMKQQ